MIADKMPAWTREDAHACAGWDFASYGDPWHPDGETGAAARASFALARQECMTCPVRAACLEYGLALLAEHGEVHGMFGGKTPAELRTIARERNQCTRKRAEHGTRSRYVAGCSCDRCTAAHARGEHERRLWAKPAAEPAGATA